MGRRIEDLNVSDEPLEPTLRRDLFAMARAYAEEMRTMPQNEKAMVALYRVPAYVRWALENLSEQTANGSLESAATAALDLGISMIRNFRGVRDIRSARLAVLPTGDSHTMEFLNRFSVVSMLAADTDDTQEFRFHALPILQVEKHADTRGHELLQRALAYGEIGGRWELCRRRNLRGRVCQPARVPQVDECVEAAATVSGAGDV